MNSGKISTVHIPHTPARKDPMRKLALAVCAVTAFAAVSAPPVLRAQEPKPFTFEVASIKLSAPPDPANPMSMVPMILPGANGSIRAANIPLRLLIRAGYKLEDEQIIGGPPWQLSTKFDITAKPEDGAVATDDALRERVKSLLIERFKLKTHTESREMNVSALTLARSDGKLGPNLKPSTADCSNAAAEAQKLADTIRQNPANALAAMSQVKCGIVPVPTPGANGAPPQLMVRGMGQPIANLVSLVTQFTGRQVVDRTGLTGNYDFELELPLDMEVLRRIAGQAGINLPAGPAPNAPQYDGPAMTTIISERLGLKLDSQKAPVDVLVIDSAELPMAD
jgi:uncharacterized protein (TIGR03435 family)